jgi:hypothetical protein
MISASLVTDNYPTDMTGYVSYAEARYGSNGDFNGDPELAVSNPWDVATGRTCWDSMSSDGFDSGWYSGTMTIYPSGPGATWDVAGAATGPTTMAGGSFGNLQTVDIRAMTTASGSVAWRNLTVTFYSNWEMTDQYSIGNGPAVDTSYASSPFASQTLQVTSDCPNNDTVVITGEFRMSCPPGICPAPADLAAQIFVFNSGE